MIDSSRLEPGAYSMSIVHRELQVQRESGPPENPEDAGSRGVDSPESRAARLIDGIERLEHTLRETHAALESARDENRQLLAENEKLRRLCETRKNGTAPAKQGAEPDDNPSADGRAAQAHASLLAQAHSRRGRNR